MISKIKFIYLADRTTFTWVTLNKICSYFPEIAFEKV